MSNPNPFPSHVTGQVWLGYHVDSDTPADLRLFGCDMADFGYVMLGPIDVTVDVPKDVDPLTLQIDALERERNDEKTRSARRLAELEDRLAQLQALPCPAVSA